MRHSSRLKPPRQPARRGGLHRQEAEGKGRFRHVDEHELLPYALLPVRAFSRLIIARARAAQTGELPHRVLGIVEPKLVVIGFKGLDRLVSRQPNRLVRR